MNQPERRTSDRPLPFGPQPAGRGRGPLGGHGPMGPMMGAGEKAHDFKGTMAKLVRYLGAYRVAIVIVLLFAAGSTVFPHTDNLVASFHVRDIDTVGIIILVDDCSPSLVGFTPRRNMRRNISASIPTPTSHQAPVTHPRA